MATQTGKAKLLKNPQPRSSAMTARPTATIGNESRKMIVSTATSARLFDQRITLEISRRRRGAATSHRAIATSTPRKAVRRIMGSAERKASNMKRSIPDCLAQTFGRIRRRSIPGRAMLLWRSWMEFFLRWRQMPKSSPIAAGHTASMPTKPLLSCAGTVLTREGLKAAC